MRGWISLSLICLIMLLGGCGATIPAPDPEGVVTITAKDQIKAGEGVEIKASLPAAPDGTSLNLLLQGSYGSRIYSAKFQKGQAVFQIPSSDTQKSGQVKLISFAGAARGETVLNILPGAAVDGVTPLVGARAITADGEHWSMEVIAPFDAYGNPPAEGTPVMITALRPSNLTEDKTIQIRHLLAWERITSGTKAGRTTLVAKVDNARGAEAALQEVPGWPVNFSLKSDLSEVPADGRKLVTLHTSILTDQYGNVLPDGTLVTFIVGGNGVERRQIPAQTIEGVATASLEAPQQALTLEIRAIVYNRESSTLQLPFAPGPATGDIPVQITKDLPKLNLAVQAGPLLGALGQFVPEGTDVTISVTKPNGTILNNLVKATRGQAKAEFSMNGLEVGNYTVQVRAGSGQGKAVFTIP